MADGRYITERDFPVYRDLINLKRSGGLNRSLNRPRRLPERPTDRRVVLLEQVRSYQTVWAAWTERAEGLNSIDLRTLGFVTGGEFALLITVGGVTAVTPHAIPYNASAALLRQRLSECVDAGGNHPFNVNDIRVGLGAVADPDDESVRPDLLNPGRWIIELGGRFAGLEATVTPQTASYDDPFAAAGETAERISTGLGGTVVEMQADQHDWYDTGRLLEVTLAQPIEDPNPLRAGSICQVNWIKSSGWTIYTAEPRKYIDEVAADDPYDPYA